MAYFSRRKRQTRNPFGDYFATTLQEQTLSYGAYRGYRSPLPKYTSLNGAAYLLVSFVNYCNRSFSQHPKNSSPVNEKASLLISSQLHASTTKLVQNRKTSLGNVKEGEVSSKETNVSKKVSGKSATLEKKEPKLGGFGANLGKQSKEVEKAIYKAEWKRRDIEIDLQFDKKIFKRSSFHMAIAYIIHCDLVKNAGLRKIDIDPLAPLKRIYASKIVAQNTYPFQFSLPYDYNKPLY